MFKNNKKNSKERFKPLLLTMYLPQFHEIPENNEFWGKGFTDWESVKKAEKLYEGHVQPKIPYDDNYYDLSNASSLYWQVSLAKKYGIDGFCVYHYWFENNKKVLYKPSELLLEKKDIDIKFCFMWDNSSWIRSWSKLMGNDWAPSFDKKNPNEKDYLLRVDYGNEEEWKIHFDYLCEFFKDERYVKINGCPVFGFFSNYDKDKLTEMSNYWEQLAIDAGFKGIFFVGRHDLFIDKKIFKRDFIYEPIQSTWARRDELERRVKKIIRCEKGREVPRVYNYKWAWFKIICESMLCARKTYLCGFVNYDDTPRRGNKATIIKGGTPELFGYFFNILYRISVKRNKEFIFLMAWNEWGEGSYLEPDSDTRERYLDALYKVVNNV